MSHPPLYHSRVSGTSLDIDYRHVLCPVVRLPPLVSSLRPARCVPFISIALVMYLVHCTLSYPVHFVLYIIPLCRDPRRPHRVNLEHISCSPHHTLAPHYPPLHRFIHPSDREHVSTHTHPSPLPHAPQHVASNSHLPLGSFFTLSWQQPQHGNTTPVTSPPTTSCLLAHASPLHAFCPLSSPAPRYPLSQPLPLPSAPSPRASC